MARVLIHSKVTSTHREDVVFRSRGAQRKEPELDKQILGHTHYLVDFH